MTATAPPPATEVPTSTATVVPSDTPTETETPADATPTETPEITPRNPPTAGASATATRVIFATRTATVTPTASPSAAPDDTEAPTPSPTETATATPSPTLDRAAMSDAALYVASGMGGGDRVAIHYLRPPRRSRRQTLVAFAPDGAHSSQTAPIVPITGDIDGDGTQELVVGQGSDGERVISDHVAVYRVRNGHAPELLDEIAAFARGSSGSANLMAADVDASVPGDEILVGEDGSQRRASLINVFGGLAEGRLRLLHSVRVVASRIAEHHPLQFVTGELDAASAGHEIAVAQPNGYVSIHALSAAGDVRLERFQPFPDHPESGATSVAVGDVLPRVPGQELVVGTPGKRDTGLVRVFDAISGAQLAEISVFAAGSVRAAVSLWTADVIETLPGAELLVGQGPDGGEIVVYSFASGSARRLFQLPGALERRTALQRYLAVGDLIPNLAGVEVAVAQPDATIPIFVYQLTAQGTKQLLSLRDSTMGTIGAITAPTRP